MASLQHLGGDRWRVRLYDDTTGKQVSKSFRANGERAAKRQAAKVETELADRLAERQTYTASFAALCDDWLAIQERQKSPSTLIAYRRHVHNIKARLGHLPATEVDGKHLDAWWSDLLDDGQTPNNIHHVRRVLRAVCRFGYKKRGLPTIATELDSPPSMVRHDVEAPDTDVPTGVLERLPTDKEWARAVKLLIFTGTRRGEVVGLRWADWSDGVIHVRHSVVEVSGGVAVKDTKGRRARTIDVLPAEADEILDQQQRWQRRHGIVSPWVFPDMRSDSLGQTPRRPGWVSLLWGRHREALGAKGVNPHALRHWFASWLIANDVPVPTVQRLLGHADASTTMNIYVHDSDAGIERAREAMRRFGALRTQNAPATSTEAE